MHASHEAILAKQLSMTEQIWKRFQELGVTKETPVQLDFAFDAPNRKAAESLQGLLEEETDYAVRVESEGMFKKTWRVSGTTQSTSVSEEILKQWVDWMVTTGLKHDCVFDGWGTEVP